MAIVIFTVEGIPAKDLAPHLDEAGIAIIEAVISILLLKFCWYKYNKS